MMLSPADALRHELGILTEEEVAAIRGKDVSTLQKERSRREGPPWVKDGRSIFYFKSDLLGWLKEQQARTSSPDPRL